MTFVKRGKSHPDDMDTDEENDETIDPELRLRTVRTAASAIAESIVSEARMERRKTMRRKRSFFRRGSEKKKPPPTSAPEGSPPSTAVTGTRRKVYFNTPLSAMEVDRNGEPKIRYVRNKVRTSKYTAITFLPKNLYEQFRRVANLYFLALVVVQVFPIFGAASAQTSMLPLVFILTVTAIKDGVEDYRRAIQDDMVNNSAATKLAGAFHNVNQPTDPRSWIEKILGLNKPGSVSKGVRKLREREASEAGLGVRGLAVPPRSGAYDSESVLGANSLDYHARGAGGRRLEDIQSVDSHSYPPDLSKVSLSSSSTQLMKPSSEFGQVAPPLPSMSLDSFQQSTMSQSTLGVSVVDWRKRSNGSVHWDRTLWKKLEVGDVVLLRDNDQVPADIIVLATSDPDGMCYLETKNLDGETNLKARKALKATTGIASEEDLERSAFVLDSEPPHQNLYVYNGVLRFNDPSSPDKEPKQEPVSINEMLLRGCALRNTQWVIGLVVFTGADTKIMMNGGDTPSKRSKIEKETNFNVVVNFIALICMCLIAGTVSGIQEDRDNTSADIFEDGVQPTDSTVINSIITFVSCLIAFQNIVPVSLYISVEIVKTIQAYFISQDIDMYYPPLSTACVPKTWNISDDLGQIEYIFSDKTGTLTQNVMEFQKCSVHGVAYGEGVTEAQRGAATRDGKADAMDPEELNAKLDALKSQMTNTMERAFKNRYVQLDKLALISPKLAEDLADRSSEQRAHLIAFFRALALCHSVLSDKPDPQNDPYHLDYKAESPDEAALVAAARDVGFPFIGKSKDTLDIEVMGQSERYTLLRTLEFNSTRKRMSVILRCPDGRLILYCKGADSVIYARLADDHDPKLKDQTNRDMESFANNGLRTLCIAYRWLTEDEYLLWGRTYDAAVNATENRDELLEQANEQIEHSLRILGATALEDKLQEGVPDAIELLHKAGIKLWILTGDKVQTAIEIGYSCNLLKSDMEVMILSADSHEQARSQIEAGLNKIASILGPPSWDPRKRGFLPNAKASFAVVIDGDTLRHALSDDLKPMFLNLGTQCETVVCCRVSPAQKALTVKLVKEGRNAMTLSIGDGANDVAMIQEANIGCGLFGLEGSQAAMSADYAFGQFRYLTKLLLVHGRWSYQRISEMHGNFFYKNVVWTFALFWYLPFNNFDATYLYQITFILLYNVVFTSLPVIVLGAFDQDINAKAALAFPQLYVRGIRGLEYTRAKFWMYMLDGLYQSTIVFFFPYFVWSLGLAISWNGKGIDSLADFGTTVAVAAIFAANVYVGMNTNYWTFITWIVVIGSSVVMLLWIAIYSFFYSFDFIDEVIVLFGGVTFWAVVFISVVVALAPRFLYKFIAQVYFPLDRDIIREAWVMGDLKDQLGIRHRNPKKNTNLGDPESVPMYSAGHGRSFSELSVNNTYEPTIPASGPQTSPLVREVHPIQADMYFSPTSSPNPRHSLVPDAARNVSPAHIHDTRNDVTSRSSYYSVSELPPASPLPSPRYRYPSGEVTNTPPPRRTSTATRTSVHSRTLSPAAPQPRPLQPSPQGGLVRRLSGANTDGQVSPGAYEMRVRSPPQESYGHLGHQGERSATDASYATAQDDFEVVDDTFDPPIRGQSPYGYARQQSQHQHQLYPEEQNPPGSRRASGQSWQGGVAM
ncbi:hypothetical protein PC9H_001823 [Pleurotus ostreatus]|uniref:Phospholipid-transporting ATPase n=2 Tax=Pleurotus ostreatus TaxID=5322 RepID=A0A8H6ZM93_PLEOS|nr:uncharacterized protein PC9H_001823 [Pleurotus ostreatus]KAF7419236.1 hypothetical protein PC9H_001823 [Pleurotus ostreatus]